MAITPRWRSSGVSCSRVLSAPRSLNEAVNCRFSNLIQMSALAMRDSVSLRRHGVRTTLPAMRRAACWTSARVTGRGAIVMVLDLVVSRSGGGIAVAAKLLQVGERHRIERQRGEEVILGREVAPVHGREDPDAGLVQPGRPAGKAADPGCNDEAYVHVHGDVA